MIYWYVPFPNLVFKPSRNCSHQAFVAQDYLSWFRNQVFLDTFDST
jgi:hypothetical protein